MVQTIREIIVGFIATAMIPIGIFVAVSIINTFKKFFTYAFMTLFLLASITFCFFMCKQLGHDVIIYLGW
jgi:hypothetical protein